MRKQIMGGHQGWKHFLTTLLLLLFAAGWGLVYAADWSAPLQSGGQVTVDPRTNRATVTRDGVQSQLWDGVHRLQDGSVVTVRSGTVVPSEAILNARSMPDHPRQEEIESWLGKPISGASPCERLVNRVCGEQQACSTYPACAPSRQLLETERRERASASQPDLMTYASGQCQVADRDRGFFASCSAAGGAPVGAAEQPAAQSSSSACQLLVSKVCGSAGACKETEACSLSQQLLGMARQQQAESAFAPVPQDSPAVIQCREALMDEVYFRRCR